MEELKVTVKDLAQQTQELRSAMLEVTINQKFFREQMLEHYSKQDKIFDKLAQRFQDMDRDIRHMDKKINYAAGIVAVVVGAIAFFSDFITKKLGV